MTQQTNCCKVCTHCTTGTVHRNLRPVDNPDRFTPLPHPIPENIARRFIRPAGARAILSHRTMSWQVCLHSLITLPFPSCRGAVDPPHPKLSLFDEKENGKKKRDDRAMNVVPFERLWDQSPHTTHVSKFPHHTPARPSSLALVHRGTITTTIAYYATNTQPWKIYRQTNDGSFSLSHTHTLALSVS